MDMAAPTDTGQTSNQEHPLRGRASGRTTGRSHFGGRPFAARRCSDDVRSVPMVDIATNYFCGEERIPPQGSTFGCLASGILLSVDL